MARKVTEKQRKFARYAKFFPVPPEHIAACDGWDEVLKVINNEIRRRELKVKVKKKGLLGGWNRFDERATMVPGKHGPILLPWNWKERSTRKRVRELYHEVTHHEEDEQLTGYEALYAFNWWRWAVEIPCFGCEAWVMTISMLTGWKGAYTAANIDRWMNRLGGGFKKSYSMRRCRQADVRRESIAAIEYHRAGAEGWFRDIWSKNDFDEINKIRVSIGLKAYPKPASTPAQLSKK